VVYIYQPLVLVGWTLVLFGFVWLGLLDFVTSFCSLLCGCVFPGLECRVATCLNLFTGSLLWATFLHCSLPSPRHWSLAFLVYPDSCEGKCFVIAFVIEGAGYQAVEGVCAGMAVLNSEYQDAHNQENQFPLHWCILWVQLDTPI